MPVECEAVPAFDLGFHAEPGSLELQNRMGYPTGLDHTGRLEASRKLDPICRSKGAGDIDSHPLTINRQSPETLMGLED